MLLSVNASSLNVRAIPSITSSVLGRLHRGDVVVADDAPGLWCEISFGQRRGYVASGYLDEVRPDQVCGTVTADLLNVRSEPSTAAPVLGSLTRGATVVLSAHWSEWLEIEFNRQLAYVAAAYVELFRKTASYTARVTVTQLQVRAGPSLAAQVVGRLTQGQAVWVEADMGDWARITFAGTSAYVAQSFIQAVSPADAEANPSRIPSEMPPEVAAPVDNARGVPQSPLVPLQQLPVAGQATHRSVALAWNRYGAKLLQFSQQLEVDTACAVAVLCVESSGKGFEQDNQNRMVIRFENHCFWRYWGQNQPEAFHAHFQYDAQRAWLGHRWRASTQDDWQSFHGDQQKEWQVLEFARRLQGDAALMSISMGAPQIMGFNFARIGYASVADMFEEFSRDIAAHISGLFRFLDASMIRDLQRLDFAQFAGRYNGPGQKQVYGARITEHYRAFKEISQGVVLS